MKNYLKIFISLGICISSSAIHAESLSLEEKCYVDDFSACSELGRDYADGWLVFFKKHHKAFKYYKKACRGDDLWACEELGVYYQDGLGVKKNSRKAIEIFEKTCFELNRAFGCELLGDSFLYGKNDIPVNYVKALNIYNRACKLDNNREKNMYTDCYVLGNLYKGGSIFIPQSKEGEEIKNLEKALQAFKIGCNNGDHFSCYAFDELYGKINK